MINYTRILIWYNSLDDDNPSSENVDGISNFVKIDDSDLDIGCGTGKLASELMHGYKEIYVLDISVEINGASIYQIMTTTCKSNTQIKRYLPTLKYLIHSKQTPAVD
ncbi:hypothetical protein EDF67_1119 [Sphingobacterium sp. JUb78]|nr:SAM-dependent methyltransferase [Sphingobacterium kitahiroshimense]TCR03791.1 hypothetical protein EDF67_1119 [Sphingobacterium sp. JUb78]